MRSARDFALALGFLDADGALTHLAPDADIAALLFDDPEGAEGIAAELRLEVRMLEAQGFG